MKYYIKYPNTPPYFLQNKSIRHPPPPTFSQNLRTTFRHLIFPYRCSRKARNYITIHRPEKPFFRASGHFLSYRQLAISFSFPLFFSLVLSLSLSDDRNIKIRGRRTWASPRDFRHAGREGRGPAGRRSLDGGEQLS